MRIKRNPGRRLHSVWTHADPRRTKYPQMPSFSPRTSQHSTRQGSWYSAAETTSGAPGEQRTPPPWQRNHLLTSRGWSCRPHGSWIPVRRITSHRPCTLVSSRSSPLLHLPPRFEDRDERRGRGYNRAHETTLPQRITHSRSCSRLAFAMIAPFTPHEASDECLMAMSSSVTIHVVHLVMLPEKHSTLDRSTSGSGQSLCSSCSAFYSFRCWVFGCRAEVPLRS